MDGSRFGGVTVLAIDQGTSGTKAIVVDDAGRVLASAEEAVRPEYRSGGSVEQDPAQLLESVVSAGRRAVEQGGVPIDAIGLANQGETVLAWDPSSGRALSSAIGWQDRRSQSVCDRVIGHAELIAARTGLVLSPYFSAPKMAWLREHVTRKGVVTTTDSWLIRQLTGEFVTDVTTASRSLVLNLDTVEWDAELLGIFGLAEERLPRLVDCDEVVGTTASFGAQTPVAGLVVDQQAALLAEGCVEFGSSKCTFGTGAFILANTGSAALRSAGGLTASVALRTRSGTQYCLDGQVYTAASAVRWMQDLGLIADARDLDAVSAADSEGVLFVPALAGLGAPHWRDDARASFSGLSLATSRGTLVRAVLEGVAAQVTVLAAVFGDDLGAPLRSLRVDGGLTNSTVLMQAQADLLQVPVEVYSSPDATALGAACLTRMALDPSLQVADAVWPWIPAAVYEARWSPDRAADFLGRWRAVVDADLAVAGRA